MPHINTVVIAIIVLGVLTLVALAVGVFGLIRKDEPVFSKCLQKDILSATSLTSAAVNRCVYLNALGPNPTGLTLTLPTLQSNDFLQVFYNPSFFPTSQPFSVTVNTGNTGGPWYMNTTDSSMAYFFVAPGSNEVQQWFAQTQ